MWPPSKKVNPKPKHGIVFDFDGTLARMSIDFDEMRRAINALFARHDIAPETLQRRFILERIDEVFDHIYSQNPTLAHQIKAEAFSLIEEMELAAAAHSHLLPGVYPRLWTLKKRGVRLAIATRNCEKAFRNVIGKAAVFFDVIITRENSLAYKPDKRSLEPILEEFSIPTEDIFMIGDHPMDILTARAASIVPIGVLTGTGEKQALVEAGALRVFKHVNQAIDALLRALS